MLLLIVLLEGVALCPVSGCSDTHHKARGGVMSCHSVWERKKASSVRQGGRATFSVGQGGRVMLSVRQGGKLIFSAGWGCGAKLTAGNFSEGYGEWAEIRVSRVRKHSGWTPEDYFLSTGLYVAVMPPLVLRHVASTDTRGTPFVSCLGATVSLVSVFDCIALDLDPSPQKRITVS